MVAMTKLGQKIVGIAATLFGMINLTGERNGTDVQCEIVSHDVKIEGQYDADESDIEMAKKWSEKQKKDIIEQYEDKMLTIDLHE